jgi:hypothetical protein
MFRAGTQIQTVLTAAVYQKVFNSLYSLYIKLFLISLSQTLRLSNSARRDKTVGEIVNLMAIDVDRFQMITSQIQQYWSSPFQVTVIRGFKKIEYLIL